MKYVDIKFERCFSGLAIIILALSMVNAANGQTMSSGNYKIDDQSINFAGNHSESSNYSLEDTLGEVATGFSSSTNYIMGAGYQQMQVAAISVTPPGNVTLLPALGGLTGGIANGNASFAVTTDNPAGYTASIKASSTPALKSQYDSIGDYIPAGNVPDFSFTYVAATSTFGFSPKGNDIAARYLDNGSACGTGSGSTAGSCWDGLSTSDKTIVNRPNSNQPAGTVTALNFRVGVGSARNQISGTYTATTTITILPQ